MAQSSDTKRQSTYSVESQFMNHAIAVEMKPKPTIPMIDTQKIRKSQSVTSKPKGIRQQFENTRNIDSDPYNLKHIDTERKYFPLILDNAQLLE